MISIEAKQSNRKYDIFFKLGYLCNYKCSYCTSKISLDSKESINDFENTINLSKNFFKIKDYIMEISKNSKRCLSLIGGETTLYPIKEIISNISIPLDGIKLTTNFSKSKEYFEDLFDFFIENNISFVDCICSFHDEFANKENFVKKLNYFLSNPKYSFINFTCQFTLTDNNSDYIDYLLSNLVNAKEVLRVDLQYSHGSVNSLKSDTTKTWLETLRKTKSLRKFSVFEDDNYLFDITTSEINYINSLDRVNIKNKDNNDLLKWRNLVNKYNLKLKGSKCFIPQSGIFIENTGDLFYCFNGSVESFNKIGNLFDKNIILDKKDYIICMVKNSCTCFKSNKVIFN